MSNATIDHLSPSDNVELPAWVDADAVAKTLGVTPATMRRLAREGRSPISVRQVGGRWRWSRADLTRFVDGLPPSS